MPKNFETAFAERMKMVRLLRELNIEEVASKVGVTARTYRKYENGSNRHINTDRIEKIANTLNCSPVYLLGGTVDIRRKS